VQVAVKFQDGTTAASSFDAPIPMAGSPVAEVDCSRGGAYARKQREWRTRKNDSGNVYLALNAESSANFPAQVMPATASEGGRIADAPAAFADVVAQTPEASHFQKFTREFSSGYDAVWQAVQETLASTKETTHLQDKKAGLLVTEYTGHGPFKRDFCKYILSLEKMSDNSSKITCILIQKYFQAFKGEDVYLSGKKNEYAVEKFYQDVAKRLGQR